MEELNDGALERELKRAERAGHDARQHLASHDDTRSRA